jgi:hypothetical protein
VVGVSIRCVRSRFLRAADPWFPFVSSNRPAALAFGQSCEWVKQERVDKAEGQVGAGDGFPKSEANSNCRPAATSAVPTTGIRGSLLDYTGVRCRPLTLCLLGGRRLGITVPSRQLGLALLARLFLILLMRGTGVRRGLFLILLMRGTGGLFGSYAVLTVGDSSLRANERAHPGRLRLELRNKSVADIHAFGRLASFTLVVLYSRRCRRT